MARGVFDIESGWLGEDGDQFQLKFWGVRGSIPSPGPQTAAYGGNTACVEITAGGNTLIIDAGSGIRALGDRLCGLSSRPVDLLFSHCHFDHIEGLPFFGPLYMAGRNLTLWSGHIRAPDATRDMVASLIRAPYFPVDPSAFRANVAYHDFTAGDTLTLGSGIVVETLLLNHPGGATGFRVRYAEKSICYISDVEHRPGMLDSSLADFVRGANVMIYDAMYTDEEYPRYAGFGHSTWQEGIKLANAADVHTLVLYHHFPGRSDDELARIEALASARRPVTFLAREGMEMRL
jgi:phosphoribosyl 1,2-cyclic phosphodiesterase